MAILITVGQNRMLLLALQSPLGQRDVREWFPEPLPPLALTSVVWACLVV